MTGPNPASLLVFAYHFPPENAVGGRRPALFCKYLEVLGVPTHVITAAEHASRFHPGAQTVPDPFLHGPRSGSGWQLERVARKFVLPGVVGTRWAKAASLAAQSWLKEHRACAAFSTFPPMGVHLAAMDVARRNGIPWIADFRDPLREIEEGWYSRTLPRSAARFMERRFVRRASAVIVNTDSAAERLKSLLPDCAGKIHVIWNGFDPEARLNPAPLPPRAFRSLAHVGELYEGRDVAPLLESVGRLIERGRLDAAAIRIRLIGPAAARCLPPKAFLDQAAARGWLDLNPDLLPESEARQIIASSEALLLVQPHTAIQVPAKLFEYLQVGRPILAYVTRQSAIERVLSQTGIFYRCFYPGQSAEEIDRVVQDFFSHLPAEPQVSGWFEDHFNAARQTGDLLKIIRSLARPG